MFGSIVTVGDRDPRPFTLLDAAQVDRERIVLVGGGRLEPGQPCAMCPTALGPPAAAVLLLRYTDLRLRIRRRRIPLCRACWSLEVVRVMGELVADVRVYVPAQVPAIPAPRAAS